MIYSTQTASPLGPVTMASDGEKLTGLWLEGQKYFAATVKEEMTLKDDLPVFQAVKSWLAGYFAGEKPELQDLPMAPGGSEFRQIVWAILCEIPYGGLTTYGEIGKEAAKRLNRSSMSGQAVGGAVGHNPISIIIPCHRVVGADGSLTGYAGGIEKKIKLLELEGADMSGLHTPKKGTAL